MKRYFLFIFCSLLALSCSKDSEIIPNVRFSVTIDIVPQYSGKSLFIIKPEDIGREIGVNGVVVWNNGGDQYFAFDRMCTHKHENGQAYFTKIIEDGNPVVKCPECDSEFLVATQYGDIVKGPAIYALKSYATSYSNGQLSIRN